MPIKVFPATTASGESGSARQLTEPYYYGPRAYNSRDTLADARPEPERADKYDPHSATPQPVPPGGWNNGNIGFGPDSMQPPTPLPAHVTPWTGLTNGRDK